MRRKQFPIKLAFAMTINKSQGQTLSRVGVFLETPCFNHGQLYVALSRVGDPSHLKVFVRHERNFAPRTVNHVYEPVIRQVAENNN